jgi:hypothetical protein
MGFGPPHVIGEVQVVDGNEKLIWSDRRPSRVAGTQGGATGVEDGIRPHANLGTVLLAAVLAAGACSSSTGRTPTGQADTGGSGPATVASAASLSITASSPTTGTSATTETPAITATTISPPAGWKTVWYHGVGADIPATWKVASGTSFICAFGATPVAYLGPTHTFYPCPMPAQGRPGNNGLWIDASYGTPSASMTETSVHGIAVDIGLAADPTMALRIEASLRYDPAV